MGNKKDPRRVTVTDEPTLLTNLQTRKGVTFLNGANDIELHRLDDFEFGEGFPVEAGDSWPDSESWDAYYAICDTGLESEVVIWEVE
jgi:hypothetical protein